MLSNVPADVRRITALVAAASHKDVDIDLRVLAS
jgi:hypothetical protein